LRGFLFTTIPLVKKIILAAVVALCSAAPLLARGHAAPAPAAIANGERVFLKIMPAGPDGFYVVWNSTHPTGSALFGQFFGVDGKAPVPGGPAN